jgi:hypothetical protein
MEINDGAWYSAVATLNVFSLFFIELARGDPELRKRLKLNLLEGGERQYARLLATPSKDAALEWDERVRAAWMAKLEALE